MSDHHEDEGGGNIEASIVRDNTGRPIRLMMSYSFVSDVRNKGMWRSEDGIEMLRIKIKVM